MSENETERAEHQRLVNALIEELKKQGFEILLAASEGYEPCAEVEDAIPDIKAFNRKKEYIAFGVAKTCTALASKQTEKQLKVLANRYMRSGKSAKAAVPLCIAISKGCEPQLEACLTKLKLEQKKNIFRYAF
jgi:hypothetical protein